MSRASSYLTGYRAIEEVLRQPPAGTRLFVGNATTRVSRMADLARANGVPVQSVTRGELRRMAGEAARDCVLHVPAGHHDSRTTLADIIAPEEASTSLVVLLDHVTDPHNLGAILRSADQFGVDGVVVAERRCADVTPVVMQVSAGAAAHVPLVRVTNLSAALERLKESGYWIYAADMNGEVADSVNLHGKVALVVGAEGPGLSRLVRERADVLIRVPGRGHGDSFNVSVAAGILLYEVRRQQGWFLSG